MLTQQLAIKTAEKFAAEVSKSGVGLRKAILFGSFAKSRQHELSDIDICLVADGFSGFGFEDMDLIMPVLRKPEFQWIQLKTYSSSDYLLENAFVNEEIEPVGIILFDNLTEQKNQALAA